MFYEEARELLISLEEGLMDLERRQGDRAHLDKTFRAAHSLKGASAMVGLRDVSEFTHGIEAVLDRIRAGALGVDSEIITTLLEARDHLAAMVEAEAAKSPIPPSAELSQRLSALLGGTARPGRSPGRSDTAPPAPPPPASAPPAVSAPPPPPGDAPAEGVLPDPGPALPPSKGSSPTAATGAKGPKRSRPGGSDTGAKPRSPRRKPRTMGPSLPPTGLPAPGRGTAQATGGDGL